MRKNIIRFLLMILSLLIITYHGFSNDPRFSFHVNAGMALPLDENIKSGFQSGFGFSYPLSQKASISFNFSYWKSRVEEERNKLLNGKMTVTPFTVSLQYNLIKEKYIIPYIFMGIGLIFTSFKIDDYVTIPEVTLTQKVQNGISVHLGVGANVRMRESWVFFAEMLYLHREAGAETRISDMNFGVRIEEFSVNLSSISAQAGVKFTF